jgi:hypothetical protein
MDSTLANSDSTLDLSRLLQKAEPHRDDDAEAAIAMAHALLIRSRELQTPQERRQQAELDRMIGHPGDKATLVEMTDQAFRTHNADRVADQLTHLLDVQGIPRFFSPLEQTMLRGFQTFGGYLPGVAVPLVKDKMRHETANVILPAEEQPLREHLAARQASGLRMNVNFLGEALLGEAEAQRRLEYYLHALQIPEIACISVKLSTIYSQVSTIARRHTIDVIAAGGTPITIRLVKGANLEMERVEASIGGYPQTPHTRKVETDANFKRMLRGLIDAAAEGVVRVGVASHNLFDIALAEADPDHWRTMSAESRREILRLAAQRMRERRGDLIGAMMIESNLCGRTASKPATCTSTGRPPAPSCCDNPSEESGQAVTVREPKRAARITCRR